MSNQLHSFWRGRRVLVTGHTGFKGAWLTLLLQHLGAQVSGIALAPEPGPSLFNALAPWSDLDHREIDLTDRAAFIAAVRDARPEVVLHLAAQAIVQRGYHDPAQTFATNVTGTIHLLEALRGLPGVVAAVIVTSDKVYRNEHQPGVPPRAFIESDPLGGADPYSASKAATELTVASWRASFADELPPLATARAGNVIGGGDFGVARLLPDLVRAQVAGRSLQIRHPQATRPWQHVLDVLRGYLMLAQALVETPGATPPALNFGPSDRQAPCVSEMLGLYEQACGEPVAWTCPDVAKPPEAPHLALDASLAQTMLGWRTRRTLIEAVNETALWYRCWRQGGDLHRVSLEAIEQECA